MSTTMDTNQLQSRSSQKNKVRFSLGLQVRTESNESANATHSSQMAVNTSTTIPSPVLRIHTEPEEQKTTKVDLPFRIASRPRFDSSDEERDVNKEQYNIHVYSSDDDENDSDAVHADPNESNKMQLNLPQNVKEQNSYSGYSLTFDEDGDDEREPGTDDDEEEEPEPVYSRRQSSLKRQSGVMNVLSLVIPDDDDISDRSEDEYHPAHCSPNDSDSNENAVNWMKRTTLLLGDNGGQQFTGNDDSDSSEDGPRFSIYGAMLQHQMTTQNVLGQKY